ncbi:MAG: probable sulfite oxidase, partial [uncultured Friedmanniella sp.]
GGGRCCGRGWPPGGLTHQPRRLAAAGRRLGPDRRGADAGQGVRGPHLRHRGQADPGRQRRPGAAGLRRGRRAARLAAAADRVGRHRPARGGWRWGGADPGAPDRRRPLRGRRCGGNRRTALPAHPATARQPCTPRRGGRWPRPSRLPGRSGRHRGPRCAQRRRRGGRRPGPRRRCRRPPSPGTAHPVVRGSRFARGDPAARDDPVPDVERRLLPGRHQPGDAAGRRLDLVAADRRDGGQPGHLDLRRPDGHADDRARHHPDLRLQRGRRLLRQHRSLVGGAVPGPDRPGGRPARRGTGVLLLLRLRLHLLDALLRGQRRPRRDGRGGAERRAAGRRAGLPGTDAGARSVRLRLGHQVAGADRVHHLRQAPGLLDRARLGDRRARAHPEPDRPAEVVGHPGQGQAGDRRGGLGPAPRHREGGDPDRRRSLAGDDAGRRRWRRPVAAVVVPLRRARRAAHRRGAGHRPRRPHPAGGADQGLPRRRPRLAPDLLHRGV